MKTKQKIVYYCDFCKKKGLSGRWMAIHEEHCTANPDRKCALCERLTKDATANVSLTPDMLKNVTLEEAVNMTNLLKGSVRCPICAFSYFRIHGFSPNPVELVKEVASYWDEKNKESEIL